jgi:hypothetical protein
VHALSRLVKEYEWIYLCIGLVGNSTFLIGSILFLSDATKSAGTWLFVGGSALMLLGAAGSALVKIYQVEEGHKQPPEVLRRAA